MAGPPSAVSRASSSTGQVLSPTTQSTEAPITPPAARTDSGSHGVTSKPAAGAQPVSGGYGTIAAEMIERLRGVCGIRFISFHARTRPTK